MTRHLKNTCASAGDRSSRVRRTVTSKSFKHRRRCKSLTISTVPREQEGKHSADFDTRNKNAVKTSQIDFRLKRFSTVRQKVHTSTNNSEQTLLASSLQFFRFVENKSCSATAYADNVHGTGTIRIRTPRYCALCSNRSISSTGRATAAAKFAAVPHAGTDRRTPDICILA